MISVESALHRLYEDSAVRDELRDTEAQTLLAWAKAQVTRIAQHAADDAAFEQQYDTLRGMLKDMNRFVGRRAELDAEAAAAKLTEISAAAQALNLPVAGASAQAAPAWSALDDSAALNTLLGMVSMPSPPAPLPQSEGSAGAQIVTTDVSEQAAADAQPPTENTPAEPSLSASNSPRPEGEGAGVRADNLYPGRTPLYPMRRTPEETTNDDETQIDQE